MNFSEIAETRQSCRSYDSEKKVPEEKLSAVLASARLAPSACNSQPYHLTVTKNSTAREIAKAVQGMGMNKFCDSVPVFIVITEQSYNGTAAAGAKIKKNDYRSIDIGIEAAYITAEAAAQGLGSCILGWFDNEKIQKILGIKDTVRLVIAIGCAAENDVLRAKKRKDISELVTVKE